MKFRWIWLEERQQRNTPSWRSAVKASRGIADFIGLKDAAQKLRLYAKSRDPFFERFSFGLTRRAEVLSQ